MFLLGNVALCIQETLLLSALKANGFTNDLDEFVQLMFHDWLLGGCTLATFLVCCYAVGKVF